MNISVIATFLLAPLLALETQANASDALTQALTFHASFDQEADFTANYAQSKDVDRTAYYRQGKQLIPATQNDDVKLVPGAGRFGGALWFPRKGTSRPQYNGPGILNYKADQTWSTTVSVWLRLDPDKDLEPGYCDPIQIVGDDNKKGYIFLEWSKDETPRYFRYAIRPLFHIWNPDSVQWADLPFAKRPMVQVEKAHAPFTREAWTHVVFTVDNVHTNSTAQRNETQKPAGRLYLNGKLQGTIENWDLTFAWDPAQVALVLGASYVGYMDDLAVFNRSLTSDEVQQIYALKNGITDLHPK